MTPLLISIMAAGWTWQATWLAPPAAVAVTLALVVLVLSWQKHSLPATAARVFLASLLVVMLSGFEWVTTSAPSPPSRDRGEARITEVRMPRVVLLGDTIQATASVQMIGPIPTEVETLNAELVNSAGVVVSRGPLVASPHVSASPAGEGQWFTATFSWEPNAAGLQMMTVRLPAAATAAIELPVVCGVVDRPLRVLLVDGTARWETRHLTRLLRATPGMTVERVVLASESTTNLPTAVEDFARFDVVVLGVFDPRDLPEGFAAGLVSAATEESLGVLWMLDGRSDLTHLAASPFAAVLPANPSPRSLPLPTDHPHRVLGTPAAAGFPWLAPLLQVLAEDPPSVYLPAAATARRPTTLTPLVIDPAEPTAAGTSLAAVLVDHTASGRLLATLVETWRWRAGGQAPAIDQFWQAVIRYLAEPRLQQALDPAFTAAVQAAEKQSRQARNQVTPSTSSDARAAEVPWWQPAWNHPLLIAMVMVVALGGWLLGDRPTPPTQSLPHHGPGHA